MSSQISLKVGATTATVSIGANITDAQVGQALTRYATSLGISTTGTNLENLTAVLTHIVDEVKRRSKAVQVADATTTAQTSIVATADAENNL